MAKIKDLNIGDTFCDKTVKSISTENNVYTVELDGTVDTISKEYFDSEDTFTKIEVNDTVTTLDTEAFANCSNLNAIVLPESIKNISNTALNNCNTLKNINVNGENTFSKIKNVENTNVNIIYNNISYNYDSNNSSWKNILDNIITGYENIPDNEIWYTTADNTVAKLNTNENTGLVYDSDGNTIECKSNTNENGVGKIVYEKSIYKIGYLLFPILNCITSIYIPNSVEYIEKSAIFANNLKILSVPFLGGCIEEPEETTTDNSNILVLDYIFYVPASTLNTLIINKSIKNGSVGNNFNNINNIIINSTESTLSCNFSWCSNLIYINIPSTVTIIGDKVFANCNGLKNIILPNNITSIGSEAFSGCNYLQDIVIPESVNYIGDYAFAYCSKLTNVSLLSPNLTLGENIFNCDTKIKTLFVNDNSILSNEYSSSYTLIDIFGRYIENYIIGDSVSTISDYAFYKNTNLKGITLSKSINSISYKAFMLCKLESITIDSENEAYNDGTKYNGSNCIVDTNTNTLIVGCKNTIIPDSVTSIGEDAFYCCSELTSITIPKNVTYIDTTAFSTGNNIETVTIDSNSIVSADYTSSNNITTIFGYNIKNYIIGNNVTSIGTYAFHGSQLTSITISDSVTTICDNAFEYCSQLTSITIPDSVTFIGASVFYYCTCLTSITIPDSVTSISDTVFANCSKLVTITIPDSVTSIGNNAFASCSSLTSIAIPNSVTSIDRFAFWNCASLASITIGNSVTSIGNNAFASCSSLTSIAIPNSVTSIGEDAFYYCASLVSMTIGNSVTSIGSSAFYHCSKLASITIPDSVTSIGSSAFYDCITLENITIGKNVTSIGTLAFKNCLLHKDNFINNSSCTDEDNWGAIIYNNIYNDKLYILDTTIVKCDTSVVDTITIPDYITKINSMAFYNCNKLITINIPNLVNTIEGVAFGSCSSLETVFIPVSVTTLGNNIFKDCTALKNINYSGTLEQWNNISKNESSIPSGVTINYNYTE